jgi:hypothetical protein
MGTEVYLIVMLVLAVIFAAGLYLNFAGQGRPALNEGRRSFLGGRVESDDRAIFIGLQIVVQVFGSDELRRRLVALLRPEKTAPPLAVESPGMSEYEAMLDPTIYPGDREDVTEKREFLKSLSSLLIENKFAWEYGFWDYRREAGEAIEQFNQWRNELESSIATTADEVGAAIDPLHRYSDEKEFQIITLMMLLDNRDEPVGDDAGTYEFRPTYAQLVSPFSQVVEKIAEGQMWEPSTFEELLMAMRALDPRTIERDAVYIIPGAAEDGLSSIDLLSDAGWKYLTDHPIRPM